MTTTETKAAPERAKDPIHRARELLGELAVATSADEHLAIAAEMRTIGRSDLALRAVDRAEQIAARSSASLYERAAALQALGYLDEARETLDRIAPADRTSTRLALLRIKIANKLSGAGAAALDHGAIADAICSRDDLALIEPALPLVTMSYRAMKRLLESARSVDPVAAGRLRRRWLVARTKRTAAKLGATLLLGTARLFSGGRQVHIASMGKFTRLADLIDRIDPLLRTLEADGGARRHRLFVLFFGGYPNSQLYDMYGRHCTLVQATSRVTRKLATLTFDMLRMAGRATEITTDYRKIGPPFLAHPAVLSFRDDENRRFRDGLARLGIDSEKRFIVFGLRDMAYYQFYGDVMSIPLEKQGRRSATHHRCPPLASYAHAAEHWAAKGHQVIRMGLRVSENLPAGLDPRVLDYAGMDRSDELDAYLFARCWFMIAGDTGLFSGAAAFDRPSVLSDLHLVQNTMYSSNRTTRNIFVPKLIRDDRSGRLLTFREQVYCNNFFAYFEDCQAAGLSIVHNEPEDIVDASVELGDRLEGRHIETAEDLELQKAYHSIYPPDFIGYQSKGLVSAAFLRKHCNLLE